MELENWTIEYVKARNAVRRTLKEHSVQGDEITFTHKHKVHHFLLSPVLRVPEARDVYTVVCLNTKQNIAFLLAHWDAFLQNNLFVLFANPAMNASWQINPKVHAMVADSETLEQGLASMAAETPLA